MTTPQYEIPTEMRDLAEKSVDQVRKAFENVVAATHKAATQVDTTTASVQSNAKEISSKAFSFAEHNMRNAFDLAQRLVRAKDLQEVLALQSDFAKTQMATLQEQAKEFGAIVQSATQGAVQTAQSAVQSAQHAVQSAASSITDHQA